MDAGLPSQFVDLVMKCIETTSSLRVLWNDYPSSSSTPTRGIRQGDPLSPYILVLCLERFSQLINREVEAGFWKPFKVTRRGPTASHLCFTDNMLLFAEASESQINQILHCLLEFIW